MKLIRVFGLVMLVLMCGMSVNAIDYQDNNNRAYYKLEDLTDATGRTGSLTNNGATSGATGIIDNAYDFDGGTDYMIRSYTLNSAEWTLVGWFKADTFGTGGDPETYVFGTANTATARARFAVDPSGNIICAVGDGGVTTSQTLSTGVWYLVALGFDGSNGFCRINDGTFWNTSRTFSSPNPNVYIGEYGTGIRQFDGVIDEVSFWNKSLSVSEIQFLYNSGSPGIDQQYPYLVEPSISFDNISLVNGSIYNISAFNVTINLSTTNTNNLTNVTMTLDGSTTSCFNESLNGICPITNQSDGWHNVSFYAFNNETNTTSDLFEFLVDTIAPNISVNNFTEWNLDYNVTNLNSTLNITCSDPNLVSCIIYWDDATTTNLSSTQSKLFITNGNHSFNLTGTDTANNTQTVSGIVFINPINYFQFKLANGTQITNYTLNGTSWDTIANYTHYELGLGTHTLLFEKFGYLSSNITFTFNTTNQLNVTYTIGASTIIVNIYDRVTGDPLNTTNVSVVILELGETTTATGQALFQSFALPSGNYSVQGIATGYYTEQKDFEYSGTANTTVSLYLLDQTLNNSATLYVPVTDEFSNLISGANTKLLEYDSSILGFKEVSQCYTDTNGECKFLVEVGTKTYIITTQKIIGGVLYTAQSSEAGEKFLPEISGGEEILGRDIIVPLTLKLSTSFEMPDFNGLIINVPKNENYTIVSQNDTYTTIYIPVSFSSQDNIDYTVCLHIYRKSGSNLYPAISPICLTDSAGILPVVNVDLNNDFDYEAWVTVAQGNQNQTFKKYSYHSESSFFEILKQEHYVNPAILILWSVLLGFALSIGSIAVWVYGAWVLAVAQVAMFPGVLFGSATVLIILINWGVLYLSKNQGDSR